MTRIPNMPPVDAGEAVPEQPNAQPPRAEQPGTHTISDGPPGGPPPASQEPPQMPFIHSQSEQPEGTFITDDQFMHDFMKETHTVPLAVLIVSTVLSFMIWGYQGFAASEVGYGFAGVLGGCVAIGVLLGVSCMTSTAAGWIISKIFGEDYGSPGALILRFSAVAAAQFPIFAAIGAVVGGLMTLFFFLPVMLLLAMFVAGLDLIRAFVYIVILNVVNWILFAFLAVSFATAVMG
jgi:hypothetical protein